MRLALSMLLLAAALTPVLSKPLPLDMDEIQRRWSAGESEVCYCAPAAPGCYVAAWFRSLGKRRAEIHAQHDHRDATPAWPVRRDVGAGHFAYATDERTMEVGRRAEAGAELLEKMRAFVLRFYRGRGTGGVVGREAEVEEAPVLRPKRNYRHQFVG